MTDVTARMRTLAAELRGDPGDPLTPARELAILTGHFLDARQHQRDVWVTMAANVTANMLMHKTEAELLEQGRPTGLAATDASRWDWAQTLPVSPVAKCLDQPWGCGVYTRLAPDKTAILIHEPGCPVQERERFDTWVRSHLPPETAALAERFADLTDPGSMPALFTLVTRVWHDVADALGGQAEKEGTGG